MVKHISIRVPWHDNGWDGNVCKHPSENTSCLRLKGIAQSKIDSLEDSICGKCMAEHADALACISEGAAFMSSKEIKKMTVHPYKDTSPKTHGHFLPTEVVYPAYSFPTRPFAWLMKDRIPEHEKIAEIDFEPELEPELNFDTNWIQQADNQSRVFKAFYEDVVSDESLCIAYSKQVPFTEASSRVIIGIGHVKGIKYPPEHAHTDDKPLRSMIWETMIEHSIRDDHNDGFVIPYQKMYEYAKEHPSFDMEQILVYAPEDAFEEFSYATEHVSFDALIDVLQSCIKAFKIINNCLEEDYSNVLIWLEKELAKAWRDRGIFPGLGAMLSCIGIDRGEIIARILRNKIEDATLVDNFDDIINNPASFLPEGFSEAITPMVRDTWSSMSDERKKLFWLMSRLSIYFGQAFIIFDTGERKKKGIDITDSDILQNPYLLYEKTRLLSRDAIYSVKKIDRATFPVEEMRNKYPLENPSKLTSDNDKRRVRALAISVMENRADNGNTIVLKEQLLKDIHGAIIDPPCLVTDDILNAVADFISNELIKRETANGLEYYKLKRINEFDEIIEKRIRKRINAVKLDIDEDWRWLIDDKFGEMSEFSEEEDKAREEKAASLKVLAESRISVLVGSAGTGKTTVLSILCNQPDILDGGVLLLAPTGKATVRLKESMGDSIENFKAQNVAQFLFKNKRYDGESMRYHLSNEKVNGIPKTVIIDESSMLTEEMFGALMQALAKAERIIFVGDPNQLPPIGAGRPFVDLVTLFRSKLDDRAFPKVCANYAELTVNRRQSDSRLDAQLSKVFIPNSFYDGSDIIEEIKKSGRNSGIEFLRWSTKEELEEKLLNTMQAVTNMSNVDDQAAFDKSLGGVINEYGTFFNEKNKESNEPGAASFVENWQILSPVHNMPHGVDNINRLIHERYRQHFISLSKRHGQAQRIAPAFGPQSIVYGDKIINLINKTRPFYYESRQDKGYLANGEIGIACSGYSKKRYTWESHKNDLKLEFSTQPGYVYSVTKADFEEEGNDSIELAYALTIHKAQGSQFNAVILVISEPCRILSRELLYTALTRQVDKIFILYNDDPYCLLQYSTDEHSVVAQRLTDLFSVDYHSGSLDMRPSVAKIGNGFYEDKCIHRTINGELVRSKSEVIIANALHAHDIPYEYEPELILDGVVKRPDFKISDPDTGLEWYWEHCGMMDNANYRKRWKLKEAFYKEHGIEEGKNLIVTYDDGGSIDSTEIEEKINTYLE